MLYNYTAMKWFNYIAVKCLRQCVETIQEEPKSEMIWLRVSPENKPTYVGHW